MSIAKNARCSQIMRDIQNGKYVKNNKFHNYGSIPEDSIYYHTMLAQKAEANKKEVFAQRKVRANLTA
tara:strand:+ start:251 stop:454 length:204 start_codon:yes stop_codon:yes gene_type:complete